MKRHAVALGLTLTTSLLTTTAHAVLCFKKKGAVVERSVGCKSNEQPVPSADLGAGPGGPPGRRVWRGLGVRRVAAGTSMALIAEFGGPRQINNDDVSVHAGSISLQPGAYVVHATVNLVNDDTSAAQVTCLIAPDTVFGTMTNMRTTLPAVEGGAGHVAVVAAGSLPVAGDVFVDCVNDTSGGLAHAENVMIVAVKVDSTLFAP